MRSHVSFTIMVVFLGLYLFFFASSSEALENSFALKMGYQFFQSDKGWDDEGLLGEDSSYYDGRNYGLELDLFPVKFVGLRFTLEYFRQERVLEEYYNDYYEGQYMKQNHRSLRIMPFTVSAKVRVPSPFVSPYFYAGYGFYYWGIYDDLDDDDSWFFSDEDDLTTLKENDSFGFQMGAGIEFRLVPKVAFLLECEYRSLMLDFESREKNDDVNASAILFNMGIMFH